ncbi:MAG: phosphatase PAP2 family protein [Granulosicoccaceae bacterium]|jgi:undecaprenyl-diphosphatase
MNRTIHLPVTVIAICCLAFILLAVYAILGKPAGLDISILAYLAQHRTGTADAVFQYLTWAGSFYVLAPLCLLISYLLARGGQLLQAWFFLSSFMLAALAARVLKNLLGSERPDLYPALVDTFTAYAFPSSHAAQITAFALALYLLLAGARPAWRVTAGLVLPVLAIAVLFSRLYLQVHYPSDVIAGGLLGVICVMAGYAIFRKQCK